MFLQRDKKHDTNVWILPANALGRSSEFGFWNLMNLSVHHVMPLDSIGTLTYIDELILYKRMMVSVKTLEIVLEIQASNFAPSDIQS